MKALAFSICLLAWNLAGAADLKVALGDFTTDDHSYRSALAAANFSEMLQTKLTGVEGVEWVERSQLQAAEKELNLSIGGFSPSATALRAGKFVKADLLVSGQFATTAEPGRTLRLELIDLEHADVLAGTTVRISGSTNQPLAISTDDIAAADKCMRTALRQAQTRFLQVKAQRVIAPLFFANTSDSHRLDFFEDELQSALGTAAAARGNVRVLQFPRAATAADEAGLVMAGLVEQDPAAWQKVADVYVWGQYEEAKADGLAFEQTPVTFTLSLWDGSDEVQTLTETVKVSELPQLKERLIKRMLDVAQSFKKRPPSETARHQVARQLLLRACDIQALPKPSGETAQGRQLWEYEVKLLATAHFFAPESYLIHRFWLECRWHRLNNSWDFRTLPGPRDLFGQRLEQIRSYDDFEDKFGLITPKEMEPNLLPAGQRLFFSKPGDLDTPLKAYWLGALRDVCDAINGKEKISDFPMDAPRNVLESWRDQLNDDLARRVFTAYETAIHANPPLTIRNAYVLLDDHAFALKDKQMKAKFIEDLWPTYLETRYLPPARHEYSAEEFDLYFTKGLLADVQRAFTEAGRPQAAEPLIAALKQKIKIVGNPTDATRAAAVAAEAMLPKLAAVDLLPPRLKPGFKHVLFPDKLPVDGVVALKSDEGVLWVSTRSGAMTWRNPAWEYLTSSHTNAAVWRLPAGNNAPEMISSKLGQHSKVTSFCAQPGRLWMTLEQDGVFGFAPATLQNTRYGDKQGVLSRQMFASAQVGGRLYFGGGEPNNGKLNYVELPGLLWKSQDLGSVGNSQILLLQSLGHQLLVNDLLLDIENGGWRSMHDELLQEYPYRRTDPMSPPEFAVLAATADSKTMWLGTTLGLLSYNPDTREKHSWFSRPGGYLVNVKSGEAVTSAPKSRLPGAVTALMDDGNFLWVAITTRFDPALSGNGHEGQWINGCYVLTLRPGCFGIASQWGGWRNMYAINERDYVLLLHKPTGKWVGYFPVTSRVTSLAVSAEKLWIGLEDTGYVEGGEQFAPSPLIEVQKASLLSIPPNQWVSDDITAAELTSRTQQVLQMFK